jgi:hypothetical protein
MSIAKLIEALDAKRFETMSFGMDVMGFNEATARANGLVPMTVTQYDQLRAYISDLEVKAGLAL